MMRKVLISALVMAGLLLAAEVMNAPWMRHFGAIVSITGIAVSLLSHMSAASHADAAMKRAADIGLLLYVLGLIGWSVLTFL